METTESGNLYFELPENTAYIDYAKTYAALLDPIPNEWSRMNGKLHTQAEHYYANDRVAYKTGVNFHGAMMSHDAHISFEGTWEQHKGSSPEPDVLAIIADGKIPAFLTFTDVGEHGPIRLYNAKGIAQRFLLMGYMGWLSFTKGNSHGGMRYTCHMRFKAWEGYLGSQEVGMQPPRVHLIWDPREGETKDDIAGIAEYYRSVLKLKMYNPRTQQEVERIVQGRSA